MILALDRLGSEKAFTGLVENLGLHRGAYGTTTGWDMTDLIAVGCDHQSMETAIGRLKETGGDGVYSIGGCGIPDSSFRKVSLEPMEIVREQVRKLEECL